MAIYVDKITEYPASMCRGLPGRLWCHLVSDTSDEELHAFAARIGMRRAWFQNPPGPARPHYDLAPSRRAAAVAAGAIEADRNTFVDAVRRRRAAGVPFVPCECSRCGAWCASAPCTCGGGS